MLQKLAKLGTVDHFLVHKACSDGHKRGSPRLQNGANLLGRIVQDLADLDVDLARGLLTVLALARA